MIFYSNESPRPNSPKIFRPFNVLSVDAGCFEFTSLLLERLRQEYPKLLRDTDLLIGDLSILPLAIGESLGIDFPTSESLLTERFKDLQLGDLNKRVVIINTRMKYAQIFSTFRNPEASLSEIFAETTGNFVENNPGVLGLAYAVDPLFGKAFLDEVRVLSIGPIARGRIDVIEYECDQLLDKQFHRVGPCIDSAEAPEDLALKIQNYDLMPALEWLKEYWK